MTAMEAALTRLVVSRSRLIRWTLTSAGFACVAVAIVGLATDPGGRLATRPLPLARFGFVDRSMTRT